MVERVNHQVYPFGWGFRGFLPSIHVRSAVCITRTIANAIAFYAASDTEAYWGGAGIEGQGWMVSKGKLNECLERTGPGACAEVEELCDLNRLGRQWLLGFEPCVQVSL